jgi:catechol 2,3-dioxygenase-like lactoylglutathione lyase family enzyme
MLQTIKKRLIGAAFDTFTWSVRVRRVLSALGRPRLAHLDHVTIPVHDLEVARRFYCEILGAAHLMTIDEAALRKLGRPPAKNGGDGTYHHSLSLGGATRIDLFLQTAGQPPLTQGHPHFAFRVPPRDMLKWKALLDARGIPTEGPLRLGFPGQASMYFNDPSGNHLEIVCHGFPATIPIRPPEMTGLAWGPRASAGHPTSPTPRSEVAGPLAEAPR